MRAKLKSPVAAGIPAGVNLDHDAVIRGTKKLTVTLRIGLATIVKSGGSAATIPSVASAKMTSIACAMPRQ